MCLVVLRFSPSPVHYSESSYSASPLMIIFILAMNITLLGCESRKINKTQAVKNINCIIVTRTSIGRGGG